MDPLTLIGIFGPVLAQLIPQIGTLFGGKKDQQNVQAIATVLDTVVKATGQTGPADVATVGTAVQAMQADKKVQAEVTKAVVTNPDIMPLLQVTEIGGGIGKAREAAATAQVADKPFWYNPLTWVTLAFFPMMYMITYQVLFTLAGPYLVSNGVPNIPLQPNPWYAVVGFDPNTRTGLINLIVGFVFGGVCGIWFGTTVAKQRSDAATQTTTSDGATVTTTHQ